MADEANADARNRSTWRWSANVSYGPLLFGSLISQTPFVGTFVNSDDMGSGDEAATYSSEFDGVEYTFWNGLLVGVAVEDTFSLEGREILGSHFLDVRDLVDEKPRIDHQGYGLAADFDQSGMIWFLDLEWAVEAVTVGTDPEKFFPYMIERRSSTT